MLNFIFKWYNWSNFCDRIFGNLDKTKGDFEDLIKFSLLKLPKTLPIATKLSKSGKVNIFV
jgi:hypothetical protein